MLYERLTLCMRAYPNHRCLKHAHHAAAAADEKPARSSSCLSFSFSFSSSDPQIPGKLASAAQISAAPTPSAAANPHPHPHPPPSAAAPPPPAESAEWVESCAGAALQCRRRQRSAKPTKDASGRSFCCLSVSVSLLLLYC